MKERASTDKPIYYYNGINLAVFLGGPIAGGILIYRNLRLINRKDLAHLVLLGFIVLQLVLVYLALFLIDDDFVKILVPSASIINILIGSVVAKYFFSKEYEIYKEQKRKFRSNWNAALIGVFGSVTTFALAFVLILFSDVDTSNPHFETFILDFSQNEENALVFYDHFDNSTDAVLADFIIKSYIPLWTKNIGLVQQVREGEEWDSKTLKNLEILEIYSEKRIEIGQTFLKGYPTGDDFYFGDIRFIESEIDSLLKEIKW